MPALRGKRRSDPATEEQVKLLRETVRSGAADRPGIYRMLAEDGEVLYVGKSKRLRSRLMSYFRCAYPEEKGARIVREARTIDWEYTPSEFAALLTELRLIKRFRPRFNVQMKRDARHYAFIKVTRGPAPKLLVVRGPSGDDAAVYYGPFQGAGQLQEAVRELSDALALRDCTTERKMIFSDQQELFQIQRTPGCIRHEIKKCLGPCVGGCSASEYDERVVQARAFLDGANDGPLELLKVQMSGASDAMMYERAASLRDKLHRLETLREQFARLRFALETLSFVYTVPGFEGEDRVYVIRRGLVRAERTRPRSTRDRRALERVVSEIFAPEPSKSATVPTHEIDELLLLSSWFRRFPDELTRTKAIA